MGEENYDKQKRRDGKIHEIPSTVFSFLAQAVVMKEEITNIGVLKKVEESKENKMEEWQLVTYDGKAQSQRKLKNKWQQKKLLVTVSGINKKSTHNWLTRGTS